jgi:hypothetical protein
MLHTSMEIMELFIMFVCRRFVIAMNLSSIGINISSFLINYYLAEYIGANMFVLIFYF